MCFFKKKKPNDLKEILIVTKLEQKQALYYCNNPNNLDETSQVLSPLGILDEGKEVVKENVLFWSDLKTLKDIKTETVYKVFYKPFDKTDIRSKYPNSYCLKSVKECKKLDDYAKKLFSEFVSSEKQLVVEEKEKIKQEIMKEDAENKKYRELEAKRERACTFKYKNTEFMLDPDGEFLRFDDIDDFKNDSEAKQYLKKFAKQKDKILEAALNKAASSELEYAKQWTNNPNLTKQEFTDNLLAESFNILIVADDSYEIWFWTNGMFTDHNLVCDVNDGVCTSVRLEG